MLDFTLDRGFLQWIVDGNIVEFQTLKETKYHLTVSNYSNLLNKIREEQDLQVQSSLKHNLWLVYNFQFIDGVAHDVVLIKLKELLDSVPNVPLPQYGICFNIDICTGNKIDASNFIMNKFDKWYGNKSAYPVEGKAETQNKELNKVGYLNNPKKWDASTKFGKKRIELLERLISEF